MVLFVQVVHYPGPFLEGDSMSVSKMFRTAKVRDRLGPIFWRKKLAAALRHRPFTRPSWHWKPAFQPRPAAELQPPIYVNLIFLNPHLKVAQARNSMKKTLSHSVNRILFFLKEKSAHPEGGAARHELAL